MTATSLDQVLETAIRREEEAYSFYRELQARVRDPAAVEALDWMARQERGHRDFLVGYRQGQFGPGALRLSEPVSYHIAEYQQEPEVSPDMASQEVYLVAAHRELRSHRFYSELAAMHPEGELRGMLLRMASEELRHKEKMEYLYANTAFPQTDGG
jgi:rubrerythrin